MEKSILSVEGGVMNDSSVQKLEVLLQAGQAAILRTRFVFLASAPRTASIAGEIGVLAPEQRRRNNFFGNFAP